MKPFKAPSSLEGISNDQERPALPDNGERPRHRAHLLVYIFPFHFGTVRRSRAFGKSARKKKAQSIDWA
jgi:fido (protein-threonine AMPylation protein)